MSAEDNNGMIFEPMDERLLSSVERNTNPFSLAVAVCARFTPGLLTISLLYINQLMSYYSRSGMEEGLSFTEVIKDVATPKMLVLAVVGAAITQLLTGVRRDQ